MTKTQFKEILEEIKKWRDTNKFRAQIYYYPNRYWAKDPTEECIRIDKVNPTELYIRFPNREYLFHDDVLDVKPSELRAKFRVLMNPFNIEKVNFK